MRFDKCPPASTILSRLGDPGGIRFAEMPNEDGGAKDGENRQNMVKTPELKPSMAFWTPSEEPGGCEMERYRTANQMGWAGRLLVTAAALLMAGCAATGGESPPAAGPFSAVLAAYRGPLNHLSAVRHGTCPMHPTCSEYARQAVAKHGEMIGWFMACDRLMRCGRDEIRRSPMVRGGDGYRIDDPLARNDFWWASPRPDLPPVPPPPAPPPGPDAAPRGNPTLDTGDTSG